MNRLATTVSLIVTLGAIATGCADPDGLRAEGIVSLTVHQSGQPDGPTGFNLPADTFIDPPPGVGRGFYGTCVRLGSRWTIDLTAAGSTSTGLRRAVISASQSASTGSASATFTLGNTEFASSSNCTGMAAPYGDKGVRVTVTCTGVSASSDPRTVDAALNLTLERCNLQ